MNQAAKSTGIFGRLYLVAILVGLTGAGLFWFLFPIKYEAKAWFLVFHKAEYLVYGPDAEFDAFFATQFAIFKSDKLLEETLNDPRLAHIKEFHKQKAPVEWLRKNIFITRVGKSDYIAISCRRSTPEDAQTVIAAFVHAYLERYEKDVAPGKNWFGVILDIEPKLPIKPCTQPRLDLTLLVGVGVFWLTLLGECVNACIIRIASCFLRYLG
ncbi:MAG: hypothetical protein FWC43_03305 [Planctomycetaceae bacterium]|nr:hypothetical protein [Planctomycetaceae bacterium]